MTDHIEIARIGFNLIDNILKANDVNYNDCESDMQKAHIRLFSDIFADTEKREDVIDSMIKYTYVLEGYEIAIGYIDKDTYNTSIVIFNNMLAGCLKHKNGKTLFASMCAVLLFNEFGIIEEDETGNILGLLCLFKYIAQKGEM